MKRIKMTVSLILLVTIGSFFGTVIRIPIGTLIGSFLFVAIAQVYGLGYKQLPVKFRYIVQILIGGLAGINITQEIFLEIKHLFLPALLSTTSHLLFAVIFSIILKRFFSIDGASALCGSIPAGMSEIAIIASDVDANVQLVILMHLFRVSLIITLLPLIITFLM
jgi:uncharacterized protein